MIDIAVLRAMAANGATVEMILAVIEAAQECEQRKLAEKRANVRERKQISRDRHASSRDVTDVTNVTVTDVTNRALISKKEDKDNLKKESKKERGCRIPPEWKPSEADREFAFSKGASHERITTETEKFRNYWLAKAGPGAVKLDWSATWKNWILQSLERIPGNPPPAPPNGQEYWKKPPWEREGITQGAWRERELAKINGTEIRRDAGLGKNGADRSSELPLSGGGALREPDNQARHTSNDFP